MTILTELTSKENDVVAVSLHYATQMTDHPGENFEIKADQVSLWLGTILMMAERIRGTYRLEDGWTQADIDPSIYLENRLKRLRGHNQAVLREVMGS